MDLSTEEHGAYLLLLMAAWRTPDCSLPNDDIRLARMARVGVKKWANMRPVMMRFFTEEGDQLKQKRLLKERSRVDKTLSQKSEAGKASAMKRNKTRSTAVATDGQQPEPYPEPYPNNKDIDAALAAYQSLADKKRLPKVRSLTDTRRKKLKARLKSHGLDGWNEALKIVGETPFLIGENDRKWTADLDFLLTESKFVKVLEGGYGQQNAPRKGSLI